MWRVTLHRQGEPDWSFTTITAAGAQKVADKVARTYGGRATVKKVRP